LGVDSSLYWSGVIKVTFNMNWYNFGAE
jgi:hypothetical protein